MGIWKDMIVLLWKVLLLCGLLYLDTYWCYDEINTFQFKEERKNNDVNGSNSNSASRGNWWKGMTTFMDVLFDKEEITIVSTNLKLSILFLQVPFITNTPPIIMHRWYWNIFFILYFSWMFFFYFNIIWRYELFSLPMIQFAVWLTFSYFDYVSGFGVISVIYIILSFTLQPKLP